MESVNNIGVIGGGSWATALIKIFNEKDIQINWWLRNEEDVKHIQKYNHNPRYLSAVSFRKDKFFVSSNLQEVIQNSEVIIIAIPSAFIKDVVDKLPKEIFAKKKIVSAVKGMIPEENILITQFFEKEFSVSTSDTAVIGGPCHAEEVALEKQAYLTIASENKEFRVAFADAMECRFINTNNVKDVIGVEYCAIIKNIIAIACGIARGLNYGDNFQAVLVSNAMREIRRLLKTAYQIKKNLTASVYLGDLLVTSYSQFSRNRTFGNMLGRGYSVKSAQVEMEMVAEGYYAVKSVFDVMQKHEVEMPITEAVYRIIYEKISPVVEFKILEGKLK